MFQIRVKSFNFFLIIILVVLISAIIYNFSSIGKADKKVNKQVVMSSANYINQSKNIDEVFNKSQLVLTGEVKYNYSNDRHGLMFTNYKVEIIKLSDIKNMSYKKGDIIEVSLVGGSDDKYIYVDEQQPVLGKSNLYAFFLKKTFPEDSKSNVFSVVGGYQGVLKLYLDEKTISYKVEELNKENYRIEHDLIGKAIEQFVR